MALFILDHSFFIYFFFFKNNLIDTNLIKIFSNWTILPMYMFFEQPKSLLNFQKISTISRSMPVKFLPFYFISNRFQKQRHRRSIKKRLFQRISQNCQENTCVGVYFLKRDSGTGALNFVKLLRTSFYRTTTDDCFCDSCGWKQVVMSHNCTNYLTAKYIHAKIFLQIIFPTALIIGRKSWTSKCELKFFNDWVGI